MSSRPAWDLSARKGWVRALVSGIPYSCTLRTAPLSTLVRVRVRARVGVGVGVRVGVRLGFRVGVGVGVGFRGSLPPQRQILEAQHLVGVGVRVKVSGRGQG